MWLTGLKEPTNINPPSLSMSETDYSIFIV